MYDSSRCAVNQCMPSLSHSLCILLLHDEHKLTVFFSVSVMSSTLLHPLARQTASSLFRFRDIFSKPKNCVFYFLDDGGQPKREPNFTILPILIPAEEERFRRVMKKKKKKKKKEEEEEEACTTTPHVIIFYQQR